MSLTANGPLVRGAAVEALADVGVWCAQLDGVDVVVQELDVDLDAARASLDLMQGAPGMPTGPALSTYDGASVLVLPLPPGEWLAELLDARRRLPVMPPRAVLTVGLHLAEALDRTWGAEMVPPTVRPDPRPVATRLGKEGVFTFGALRVAGRPPRDAGEGKGAAPLEDTRGEDLFLLGTMLYEMATRRRFGRGGTTAMIQRHHVQRRLTAAASELDAFGERRTDFVDLLLSLVGAERDLSLRFESVAGSCRDLLARLEGEGLAEWAAHVFPEPELEEEAEAAPVVAAFVPPAMTTAVRPAGMALPPRGSARTEEFTPIMIEPIGPGDEATDLGTEPEPEEDVDPADNTETSEEATGRAEGTRPIVAPSMFKIPPPSFGPGAAEPQAEEEEEGLPENVVALRGDARPGRRRGGLVPKGLDAAEAPVAPTQRTAPARASEQRASTARAGARRSRWGLLGVAAVALVPLLVLGGALLWLAQRQSEPEELSLAPSAAVQEPPGAVATPTPAVVEPTPAVDAVALDVVPEEPPPVALPASVPTTPSAAPVPPPPTTTPVPKPPPVPPVTKVAATPPAVRVDTRPPPVASTNPWAAPVAPTGPLMSTFNSRPGGILVTVDGAPRGTTPIQVVLSPGPHSLSYETDGKVFAREIQVDPTGSNTWTLNTAMGKIE